MKRKAEDFSFIDILCQATVVYAVWLIMPCLVKLLLSKLEVHESVHRDTTMKITNKMDYID